MLPPLLHSIKRSGGVYPIAQAKIFAHAQRASRIDLRELSVEKMAEDGNSMGSTGEKGW